MTTQIATSIEIGADDLPLHRPVTETPAWNYYPRVFLNVTDTGEAKCPYRGTVCKLAPGAGLKGHHWARFICSTPVAAYA